MAGGGGLSALVGKKQKQHRKPKAGVSAEKKAGSDKKKRGVDVGKQKNPKAFTFQSAAKARRLQSRTAEKEQRRLHVPIADRTSGEPPPFVVVVQGPPQVGKTLLIKSLVKHYTKHNLSDVRGPITIVSGKHRRLQFVECANDINAMIDAAKFADLVLLLVDGSYGFEMETFEFLNILQVHGFPKVMGILTHLDEFKDPKRLRKTKKNLKNRFWTEIYDGAKLFYLSGLLHGKYPKREVLNLARFISVAKFRPLLWRMNHPYVVADRLEDVTPPEKIHTDAMCDRNVTIYGYLRGSNLKPDMKVHIAGVGDCRPAGIAALPDPCPLPSATKKKGLREKEKLLYAPMSDVGDMLYDKDAVYININDHLVTYSKPDDNGVEVPGLDKAKHESHVGEEMVKKLQKTQYSIDDKLNQSFVQLFKGSAPVSALAEDDNNPSTSDEENGDHEEDGEDMSPSEQEDEEEGESDGQDYTEPGLKNGLPVEVKEFQNGRLRRRAMFPNNEIEASDYPQEKANFEGSSGDDESADEYNDVGGKKINEQKMVHNSDGEKEMGNATRWKAGLLSRAAAMAKGKVDLMHLVYGQSGLKLTEGASQRTQRNGDSDDSEEEELFRLRQNSHKGASSTAVETDDLDADDCSKLLIDSSILDSWNNEGMITSVRDRFVTGDWNKAARRERGEENMDSDEELFGDFEDLETGQSHGASEHPNTEGQEEQAGMDMQKADADKEAERRLKKLALRSSFDAQYPSSEFIFWQL